MSENILNETQQIYSKEYDVNGSIVIKDGKYHLRFVYNTILYKKEICKVTESSTMFICEAALYEMEKMIKYEKVEAYLCSMK